MTVLVSVLSSLALVSASAQVPIHAVSAPTARTSQPLHVSDAIELAGGRLLINSNQDKQLLLLDAGLSHPIVLADTNGTAATMFPRFGKLIPFVGDSVLFVDSDSRSLVLIGPDGKLGRVLAPPKLQDFNRLTSGGTTGTDAQGRLVYPGQRPMALSRPCQAVAQPADVNRPPPPRQTDSVTVLRANFETRAVDTLAKFKTVVIGLAFPTTVWDANCRAISARMKVNPEIPATDSWVVTSNGTIAIVRGHDYHIDWIDHDGALRSSPKMPFDWRRLTDEEKQRRIDSARHVVDSLVAIGGYRMQACGGGRSTSFNTSPPPAGDGSVGRASPGSAGLSGGGGRAGVSVAGASIGLEGPPGGNECQTVTVGVDYATPAEMADYIPPIREGAAKADRDGNIWILPTTSTSAKGGLLYDVVNPKGELFERVQLPAGRDIEAFGRGGVLYLANIGDNGTIIERVKVLPGK